MSEVDKFFGKHVKAFFGSINGRPLRPFISVSPNDDGEFGEWLTLKEAEALAKNILRAVDYLCAEERA